MGLKEKIKKFFLEQPRSGAVFQIAPSYFACLKINSRNTICDEDYFWQPLPSALIEANLLQSNIKQPETIGKIIEEAVRKINPASDSITLILPEMSSRVFIFNLESALMTPGELVRFVEWKLDHQLSQPLERIRYSYQTFNSGREKKVLVVCTGIEVVKEYEAIFRAEKLQPGKVTIPSISVLSFLTRAGLKASDFLLVDVDRDYLSLVAMVESQLFLYRQKQLWPESETLLSSVLKEAENTFHFIEDKTKRKPEIVYLRTILENPDWLKAEMEKAMAVEVIEVLSENRFLVPLIGGQ